MQHIKQEKSENDDDLLEISDQHLTVILSFYGSCMLCLVRRGNLNELKLIGLFYIDRTDQHRYVLYFRNFTKNQKK